MAEKKLVIADGHHRYETALNYRNEDDRAAKSRRAHRSRYAAATEFAMMTFINTHSKGLDDSPDASRRAQRREFRLRALPRLGLALFRLVFVSIRIRRRARRRVMRNSARTSKATAIGRRAIGIYPGAGSGAFYLFLLKRNADLENLLPDVSEAQRGLDVVLLHRLILDKGLGITA